MKKLLFVYLFMLFALTGCIDRIGGDALQLVDPEDAELHFSEHGGKMQVSVRATGDWGAEADIDWCITAPARATKDDALLIVLVDKNRTSEEREGTVTLKSGDFSLPIRIIQEGLLEDDEQTPEPEPEQPSAEAETFLVLVSHDSRSFNMPLLSDGFSGVVLWGDGYSDDYVSSLYGHTYRDAAERSVVLQLEGDPENFEMQFESLDGILRIDMSGLPR